MKSFDEKEKVERSLDKTYPAGYNKGEFTIRETGIFKNG